MSTSFKALSRRSFLLGTSAAGLAAGSGLALPFYARAADRPVFTHGVQSGDVDLNSGMIWTRVDRPSRIMMEYSTTESFANPVRLPALNALPDSDYAVKRLLADLPADQEIFYRFTAADLSHINSVSETITGRFRTAPASKRDVRFVWSGDTVGQGWGIDETGMKTYATMAKHQPDFFLHSGDTIYADGPLKEEVDLKDGTKWKNVVVTDEKRKVAETLDEYRGQWKYNMMDKNVLELSAICPTHYQWDDHEVLNNWSSGKDLTADSRYSEKSIALLSARAARAFHEMTPIRYTPAEPGRVYRKISHGPLVDVFFLDMRSYRGSNHDGMETVQTPESRILGAEQVAWLKRELTNSKATWKIIAADMPLGLIVWDDFLNKKGTEAVAQGHNGEPRGRELEIAELLRHMKMTGIRNTVWLTADVHYTAAHYYNPDKAAFQDFDPFWEFVSGPLHAGTFGPSDLDMTFGPELKFVKAPTAEQGQNLPPSAGLQFFGIVDVDGVSEQLSVRLMDRDDNELYKVVLDPVRSA
ncbi:MULTISPECIES: alkaline phosphatase D family protein [Rhizobium/Agrobacterium group]|uniref:alkaline phosphatase D family protein n=1 Tax=Rhizobium/Agrobacterium group TaxID=227290 RepID=UPI000B3FA31F|nr:MULTISPECIES: alkaline phosphatase D family protein [Rhizobium/Agrobacterium group]MCF1473911.1 alkaline phosphatase [Allorhizobium ampelinum]NSZ44137.1 alkaline phosphatase [Agrobacterium vitis]NTA27885.1 alkaline phosphatase [Allorhizobium ampelinum]OVE93614.1 alkaline phosphatase [Allorhizobium ampelinum]